MAKEPKKKDKDGSGALVIPIEQFRHSRDQIIETLNELQGNLQSVQSGLQNMMTVYLRHSASVLAGGSGAVEPFQGYEGIRGPAFATEEAVPTGKKRGRPKKEKKPKDPDAPKRPLTAAFLYTQQARPVVKADMEEQLGPGKELPKGALTAELTRRWADMPEEEKELWKESYRDSLKIYNQEVAAYRQSKGIEHNAEDLEADVDDADAGAIPSDIDASSEEDSDEDSPTRPKAPTPPVTTPKSNKRQKAAKTNGVVPPPILPAVPNSSAMRSTVPIPVPSLHRATSVKPPVAQSPAVENGKVKSKKPKDKEPSPEESKKKRARRNAADEDEVVATSEPPKKKRDHRKKKESSS